jgi:putative spermidine/putrescine transport system substrate-binding protein
MRHPRRTLRGIAALIVAATVLAGCSGGGDEKPTNAVRMARTIGQGEGALTLVAWPGYAENGSSDPRVDWVTPFEQRTKCKVSVKSAATAQEMVDLMSDPHRRYDGVSAPPEVAGQLIAAKQVAPVNPDLVDGYKDLDRDLRGQLTEDEKVYGVPFVWGVNQLMYDPKVVRPAPTSWAALFDPAEARKYAGRIVVRDSPLTIADAALYLRSRNPALDITDAYSLTRRQLDAAAEVLAKQRPYVKSYWLHPSDAINSFAGGDAVLGEVWPYHVDVLSRAGRSAAGVTPKEGVTGWMDGWMLGARAEHPSCMYQWLNWMTSPDVQQQVAEWDGVAPANPEACSSDRLKAEFCSTYHVGDRAYIDKVVFAHTPSRDCGGGRRDCTDYKDWTRAWSEALK